MSDRIPDAILVAKLRPLIDEVQRKYHAKCAAESKYEAATRALKTAVGPGHVFTNEMCRVNEIGGHIYDKAHAPAGAGRRNCILCGIDDFDF